MNVSRLLFLPKVVEAASGQFDTPHHVLKGLGTGLIGHQKESRGKAAGLQ
jgi:hypothetical protein